MRTVRCYDDSNTWGFDPATRTRFPAVRAWSQGGHTTMLLVAPPT
jgi:hypothetical protein